MTQQSKVASLPAIQTMAATYGLDAAAFVYTFKSVAMPAQHSEPEFVSCCLVAKEHGLNPLTKEIYFMKTKAGAIQPIVSVDGWIRKCNEHPQFDGLEFHDKIESGKLHAIECSIYRKDRARPTTVTEYMSECSGQTGPWKSHPSRMLRHKALIQCARIAFGFAGVMDQDEFDQWQRSTKDVTPQREPTASAAPDIPDDPPLAPAIPDAEIVSEEIGDADGFLAKLEEDVSLCESVAELREIADANADVIARLPQRLRLRAAQLFSEAAE